MYSELWQVKPKGVNEWDSVHWSKSSKFRIRLTLLILWDIKLHLDYLLFPTSQLFQLFTWNESISLNLHSRVKIEDESHGCGAKFSSIKSQLSRGVLHYPECGCEFVLFAFLSHYSLQDIMVNSDKITVRLKQVMKKDSDMWNQKLSRRWRTVHNGKLKQPPLVLP